MAMSGGGDGGDELTGGGGLAMEENGHRGSLRWSIAGGTDAAWAGGGVPVAWGVAGVDGALGGSCGWPEMMEMVDGREESLKAGKPGEQWCRALMVFDGGNRGDGEECSTGISTGDGAAWMTRGDGEVDLRGLEEGFGSPKMRGKMGGGRSGNGLGRSWRFRRCGGYGRRLAEGGASLGGGEEGSTTTGCR